MSISLEIASAVLALAVAVFHYAKAPKTDPMTILARAAGLSILPQSLLFIFAIFYPPVLCRMQGLRPYFALSGLALLYICVKSVKS